MQCTQCGQQIDFDDALFCPNCASPLDREPEVVEAVVEEQEVQPNSVPFEDASRPFLERYWQTLVLCFSDPRRLFSNMREDDLITPTVFAVITGTASGILGMIWQIMFGGMATLMTDLGLDEFAFSTMFYMFSLALMPLMVVIGLFIWAALFHVCLMLLGTRVRGFGITLRAVAYGYGPSLLAIVPFCGGIIGLVWSIVIRILGAIYGHRTEPWRAIVAFLIPAVICFGMMMFLVFMVISLAAMQ